MLRSFALCLLCAAAYGQGSVPTVAAATTGLSFSSTLCPGLFATVYGTNFGTDSTKATVTIGGKAAYVYSQGYLATQMDIQIPFELSAGSQSLTVSISGSASSAFPITLGATSPAFTSLSGAGTGLATIYIANTTAFLTPASPAQPGATLTAFVVGLGATNRIPRPPESDAGRAMANLSPRRGLQSGGESTTVLAAEVVPPRAGRLLPGRLPALPSRRRAGCGSHRASAPEDKAVPAWMRYL